jgi:beta-N-acetylglucosaminidase
LTECTNDCIVFSPEKVDNSLDNLDEQEKVWSELAKKKQEMKDKHKDYREGLERLKGKVTDKDNSAAVFEDPRVYKLWALAQKTGMSKEELDSVRVGSSICEKK